MIRPHLFRHCFFLLTISANLSCLHIPANAQTELIAEYEGKEYPLYYMDDSHPFVLVDGKRKKGDWGEGGMRDADAFKDGFVETRVIRLETPKTGTQKKRTADEVLFKYEVELTSNTDLDYCFGVLVYLVNGNPTTYYKSIGKLRSGKPKKVKFETTEIVSQVGNFHVFSEGMEVRTPGVEDGNSIRGEFLSLQKQTRGVPVIELLDTERRYPHLLSRDGKHIVTFRDRGTHTTIAVISTTSLDIDYEINVGEYENFVTDLSWVSDDEVLFIMRAQLTAKDWRSLRSTRTQISSGTYTYRIEGQTHLYYYQLGQSSAELVKEDVSRILKSNLEDRDLVVLEDRLDDNPYRFNFRTKETEGDQSIRRGQSVYLDNHGVARIRAEIKGDFVEYRYKEDPSSRWKPLDDYNRETGFSFNYHADEFLEQRVEIEGISPDPYKLYLWLANDQGIKELALYDIPSGSVEKIIFNANNYDLGGSGVPDALVLHDKETDEIIGIVAHESVPRVRWISETFRNYQAMVDAALPNRANLPVDWSPNGDVMIYFSYDHQSRGQYYLFRPKEKDINLFYDLSPRLKNHRLGTTRPFKYPANDGYLINGYLTFPPDYKKGDKMPLIVMPHGGPMVRDIYEYKPTVQYFAALGYGVLQMNYRGSSGYGIDHLKQGLEGEIGGRIIDDIADGTRFLIEKGFVDGSRVAITGASFGGYCTYMGLIRYPELFKVGVAVSAISQWELLIAADRYYGHDYGYSFWKNIIERAKDPQYAKRISPLNRAEEVQQPLLLIHGAHDRTVPFDQATLMQKALRKAGTEVDIIEFPNSGHSFPGTDNQSRYLEEIRRFIEKHI